MRRTEREADRLMPWLLANAGYDPAAAARFWRQWGKKHDAGLLMVRLRVRGVPSDSWTVSIAMRRLTTIISDIVIR